MPGRLQFLRRLCPVLCLMGFTFGCRGQWRACFTSLAEESTLNLSNGGFHGVSVPLSSKRAEKTLGRSVEGSRFPRCPLSNCHHHCFIIGSPDFVFDACCHTECKCCSSVSPMMNFKTGLEVVSAGRKDFQEQSCITDLLSPIHLKPHTGACLPHTILESQGITCILQVGPGAS